MPVSKSKRRRFQPPPKPRPKPSPRWIPFLVVGLLALGVVDLVLYYLGLTPGGSQTKYLIIGFALIASGFGLATQWR